MEIIEKQVEKTKEVPCGYWENCSYGGYSYGRNVNSKANAGLTLGIIGTVLGGAALLGRRNSGFNLFGNSGYGTSGGSDANIAIASCGVPGGANGITAPTAFQAWGKGCEDTLALQAALYNQALNYQNNRFADRQQLNSELFNIYKTQVDADLGLYKSTRDALDVVNATHNRDAFQLYKSQRDADDALAQRISNLEQQVAINTAIRPYQDKLIQCEIDKAYTAGINYTDRKTCKMIVGQVVLPNTPTVTGFGSYCCCPAATTTTPATT